MIAKLFVVSLIFCTACSVVRQISYGEYTTADDQAVMYRLRYGYHEDRLVFVLFESGKNSIVSPAKIDAIKLPGEQWKCSGFIDLPSGKQIDLLKANKGFVVFNQKVAEFELNFTKTDLELFLSGKHDRYDYIEFTQFLLER